MNKGLNSIIFVVAATLFLSLATLVIFFALLLPLLVLLPAVGVVIADDVKTLMLAVIFIASLLGGLMIYNAVLKLVIKKYDIEKYLPERKQKPPRPENRGSK